LTAWFCTLGITTGIIIGTLCGGAAPRCSQNSQQSLTSF
jgi:hypothetical protein